MIQNLYYKSQDYRISHPTALGELDKKVDTKLKSVRWNFANEVLDRKNGLEPDSNDFKCLNRFFEQDEEIQNNFLTEA